VWRLKAAGRWVELDLVFPTQRGTFADGPTVTRSLQRMLEEAGLPRQRFHDLRHATASLQLGEGADLFAVKELLGHSQIALTANTYGHMTKRLSNATADRMDRALQSDTKTDTKTGNTSGTE
jgi:integrase